MFTSRYLKEFRVEQCKAFLQHKCNQHRPFTCFHWHFMNQRRRRPVKRRDGTFNYSPDVYCTFYDETTGICPNSDEYVLSNTFCVFLKIYFRCILQNTSSLVLYLVCIANATLIETRTSLTPTQMTFRNSILHFEMSQEISCTLRVCISPPPPPPTLISILKCLCLDELITAV